MNNKPDIAIKIDELNDSGILSTIILDTGFDLHTLDRKNAIYLVDSPTNAPIEEGTFLCKSYAKDNNTMVLEVSIVSSTSSSAWTKVLLDGVWGEWRAVTSNATSTTNGKQVELQKNTTHIQWKYTDEDEWKDLISIEELKGERGEKGEQGQRGETGLQGERGEQGLQGLQGEQGEKGDTGLQGERGEDGREIELRKGDGFIQYKYSGEEELSWKNIISIEELKGEKGDSADVSQFYTKGEVDGKVEGLSPKSHTHTKENISDFDHTHSKSEITDFTHEHTKSEISDFSHTHTKEEISDFPTSLPANGGNADTVGGKSQDFFAPKSNPTLDGEITVNGDIVLSSTKKLKWNVGREGESEIFWHADAGTDFGLIAKVDGQQQMILEKNKFPRFNINGEWKEIGGGGSGELKWGRLIIPGKTLSGNGSLTNNSFILDNTTGNILEIVGKKLAFKEAGTYLCFCVPENVEFESGSARGVNFYMYLDGESVFYGYFDTTIDRLYKHAQVNLLYSKGIDYPMQFTVDIESSTSSGSFTIGVRTIRIYFVKLQEGRW